MARSDPGAGLLAVVELLHLLIGDGGIDLDHLLPKADRSLLIRLDLHQLRHIHVLESRVL